MIDDSWCLALRTFSRRSGAKRRDLKPSPYERAQIRPTHAQLNLTARACTAPSEPQFAIAESQEAPPHSRGRVSTHRHLQIRPALYIMGHSTTSQKRTRSVSTPRFDPKLTLSTLTSLCARWMRRHEPIQVVHARHRRPAEGDKPLAHS